MTPFDYLSVLISIVLGLSITQLLQGFAAMVRGRDRIKFYWPLPVVLFGLFLINVQVWWAMFGLRYKAHWTFAGFFIVLLQPVALYLMSAFLSPDIPEGRRLDLREFYFREKNWFFCATMASILISLVKDIFVVEGHVEATDFGAHAVFFATGLTGLVSKSDTVQKLLAPLLIVLFCAYIAMLFVMLPR